MHQLGEQRFHQIFIGASHGAEGFVRNFVVKREDGPPALTADFPEGLTAPPPPPPP